MKKKAKKLKLSRETLRDLKNPPLVLVGGGSTDLDQACDSHTRASRFCCLVGA